MIEPCISRVPQSAKSVQSSVFGVLKIQQVTCYQQGLRVRIPPVPPSKLLAFMRVFEKGLALLTRCLLTQHEAFVRPDSNHLSCGMHWNSDRQDFISEVREQGRPRRHEKRFWKETGRQCSSFRDVVSVSYQTGDVRETGPHKTISSVIAVCQEIPATIASRLHQIRTCTYV